MLYKQIQEEINSLRGMRNLVETYEEIAAMRTRRVKKSVLQNRDFLSGLNDIFQQVEHSYETQIKTLKNKTPSTANNGKTVSVFISANTGLYGDIIKRTFNLYLKDIQNKETDMVIVGRLGKVMLEEVKSGSDYKYFEISDTVYDEQNIKNIFSYLIQYKNIIVYHGIFKDMLTQVPNKSFITRDVLDTQRSENEEIVECIFEPSLENIVTFFETQILISLFEQTIYESNLSKFASRMINLDYASVNITGSLNRTIVKKRKVHHRVLNSKQLGLLTSMNLWKA